MFAVVISRKKKKFFFCFYEYFYIFITSANIIYKTVLMVTKFVNNFGNVIQMHVFSLKNDGL